SQIHVVPRGGAPDRSPLQAGGRACARTADRRGRGVQAPHRRSPAPDTGDWRPVGGGWTCPGRQVGRVSLARGSTRGVGPGSRFSSLKINPLERNFEMEKMSKKGFGNQESQSHKMGGETTSEKSEGSGNHLAGAVKELYKQHPHAYSDLGPHQGTSDHVRHKP